MDRDPAGRAGKPGSDRGDPVHRRRLGRRRTAKQGTGPCPHLHVEGDPGEGVLGDPADARCYAGERPERVGAAYQASVCRAASHRNCPRFVENRETTSVGRPVTPGHNRRLLQRAGIPSVLPQDAWPEGQPPRASAPASLGTARGTPASGLEKRRKRVSFVEFTVLGLALSIFLVSLFIDYAIVYRLQLGSGIGLAATSPGTPAIDTSGVRPTLVPTFTPAPTSASSPEAGAAAPGRPTPVSEPAPAAPTPASRVPAMSPPTRLVIPKIGVDLPVLPVGVRTARVGGKDRLLWGDVPNAGGFHETSAYPGNPGNTVINGHRDIQGSVFRHLDRVDVGDEIILYVGDVAYPYRVTEIRVVPETFASAAQRAENVRLIGFMPEERLTLITCTPVGLATHRLLVIATPPELSTPQMPEAGAPDSP
jgi:sortase A